MLSCSCTGQVAGNKLDLGKALKFLYGLGHLTLHEMSESRVRIGHRKLQVLLHIYFSLTSCSLGFCCELLHKGMKHNIANLARNYQTLNLFWFIRFSLLFEKNELVIGHSDGALDCSCVNSTSRANSL